jgi:hypothetical protein
MGPLKAHKPNRRFWLILVRNEVLKIWRRGEKVRPSLLAWTGEDVPALVRKIARKA